MKREIMYLRFILLVLTTLFCTTLTSIEVSATIVTDLTTTTTYSVGSISIKKVNKDETIAEGIGFILYKIEKQSIRKITEKTTEIDGIVIFTELKAGMYRLEEKTTSNIDENIFEVILGEGESKEIEVADAPVTKLGSIVVTICNSDKTIPEGITVKLAKVHGTHQNISESQADAVGVITFHELDPGCYKIFEVVPKGYTIDFETEQVFTLKEGETKIIEIINVKLMNN